MNDGKVGYNETATAAKVNFFRMPTDQATLSKPRFSTPLLLGMILAATFLVYVGTLQFEFVYDDLGQIVGNPAVQNWKYFPLYFHANVWMQQYAVGNYYRPVFLAWLLLNYTLFGLHASLWHLMTVLAHLGVTALVFLLALRLTRDRKIAAMAALLFGLHPVHLEAVAWISGVTEPLLALFLIPAFLAFLKAGEGERRRAWMAGSLVLYALALLCKETAVVLPVLVFAQVWLFAPQDEKWTKRFRSGVTSAMPYLAVTGAYLAARTLALHGVAHTTVNLPARIAVLTIPSALWAYVRLLVAPVGLSVFYDTPYVTHVSVRYVVAPLIGLGTAGALLLWWWRKTRSPVVAFASVWMLLPLLPLLDLSVLPMGDFIHDRYVYLPSVGFVLLLAMFLVRLDERRVLARPAGQAAALALAFAMAFATVAQSVPWANDLLLYYHGMAVAPNNDLPRNKLAASLVQRGMYEEGIKLYQVVLATDPDYWYANYRMGFAQYKVGRYEAAERYLSRATQLHGTPDEFYYLGLARIGLGRYEQAEAALKEAIRLDPGNRDAQLQLAHLGELRKRAE